MTLAVWNCHSRKVSPPPRVRETKRSPRQILLKQYLPGFQTPAKLPLSGGTKVVLFFVAIRPISMLSVGKTSVPRERMITIFYLSICQQMIMAHENT